MGFDQGSSSSKAVLTDQYGKIIRTAAVPLKTFQPAAGRVEHDPSAILRSQLEAAKQVLTTIHKTKTSIAAIGIANQRSTFLLWDKGSGRPLGPAISWQDLRADGLIPQWEGHREGIRSKIGLMLTPYYAAPKIRWLLDHVKGLRAKADRGKCLFGTINTWLIWHLTRGEIHATDHTNAARTLLMNLFTLSWDEELLSLFDIPSAILPQIYPTTADFGQAHISGRKIPVRASIGDQQAGLIGIGAVHRGESVVNYGTGGFFLVNTGSRPIIVSGLLSSLAWTTSDRKVYVAEGTVNSVGTLFEWLKESGWIKAVSEIDRLAGAS
ncbi:MAG TPA: FGGY family carbohydrate kinase, partial [Nitrospiria bacterium]|nr:FGGY family carbohydrate kinase [Nitrospiria bacterium]